MANSTLDQDQITLIWNEYKDQQDWQRHNEGQRANFTNILLILSGALVAFLPNDRALTQND